MAPRATDAGDGAGGATQAEPGPFAPCDGPRLFGQPCGADLARDLAEGLARRMAGLPPEALARAEILVGTGRLARGLAAAFAAMAPILPPRVRLIGDLAADTPMPGLAPAAPRLRRRLEIARLVGALLETRPELAPGAARFDLAESLAELMEEMHDEGVRPEDVAAIDVGDLSAHWERNLAFVRIVQGYFESGAPPDGEARQRAVVERLVAQWAAAPPAHPLIVAGSTGSRGATALLMRAVARLPQGAVVLPGFDFDLPGPVWAAMDDPMAYEDHPQYRFRRLMDEMEAGPEAVRPWTDAAPPAPARNRLISLALRPAPVTDAWRAEGPALGELAPAAANVSLVEAPSPRAEALAIALRLRRAAEEGIVAALVSPDRGLTRQVTAALDRWGIIPDDSAGMPLQLSPPGRFLRQVARLCAGRVTVEALLSLLKHPLVHSGADRNRHLLVTRELELRLREVGPPYPTGPDILAWAECRPPEDEWCRRWCAWLAPILDGAAERPEPLPAHAGRHLRLAEALACGSACQAGGSGRLWDEAAGIEARRAVDALLREAEHGGDMGASDYAALFDQVIGGAEVRRAETPHPRILIWGTLEARVGGVDLAILGGLNDGVWPERPLPGPWMNREMRGQAGMALPERAVGLSAHDFQQAAGAPEIWLTRSRRDAEAETVPSRWLNRLANLMGGLPEGGGPAALEGMRARGAYWLALAEALGAPERPVDPEPRPAPAPPAADRPRRYSVSAVRGLIRDPYAVYAGKVLRLRRLAPLRPGPDAALRGEIVHAAFDAFASVPLSGDRAADRARLLACMEAALEARAPWPTARRLWLRRLARVAEWFLDTESVRQARAAPFAREVEGRLALPEAGPDVVLTARADRIDLAPGGEVIVYDYKTGSPPTRKQQVEFDRQLLIEAMMAERGAFEGVPAARVLDAAYIGVGAKPVEIPAPLDAVPPERVHAELAELLRLWLSPSRGYTARRATEHDRWGSDYDHLSRLGEWEVTDQPRRLVLT